ncbi:hypothetical protein AN958_09204 [Leucoagaricus sp. SymC.cos]|nr:hypothetical protein AN958_09204 [Leucoagaricus sp. SymC.cos]
MMAAIQKLDYISYTSITLANHCRATFTPIIESPIIAELSSLLAKPIDRSNDRNISMQDWYGVAAAVERETRRCHGDERADALQHHHQNVIGILQTHSWQIAVDYDIQQRELAYMDKRHDYTTLDGNTISLIATKAALQAMRELQSAATSPLKRRFIEDSVEHSVSPKRQRGANCFRCGLLGHLPADCSATVITAGKPPAWLLPSARSLQALQLPNGSQFCFSFATRSTCKFGSSCSFAHACSLCGGASHGAGSCRVQA